MRQVWTQTTDLSVLVFSTRVRLDRDSSLTSPLPSKTSNLFATLFIYLLNDFQLFHYTFIFDSSTCLTSYVFFFFVAFPVLNIVGELPD